MSLCILLGPLALVWFVSPYGGDLYRKTFLARRISLIYTRTVKALTCCLLVKSVVLVKDGRCRVVRVLFSINIPVCSISNMTKGSLFSFSNLEVFRSKYCFNFSFTLLNAVNVFKRCTHVNVLLGVLNKY